MTVELWERNNVSELLAQGYTSQHSGAAGMNMAPFNHEAGVRLYNANTYFYLFYKASVILFSALTTWCLMINTTNSDFL